MAKIIVKGNPILLFQKHLLKKVTFTHASPILGYALKILLRLLLMPQQSLRRHLMELFCENN